jgi:hypothetical protein
MHTTTRKTKLFLLLCLSVISTCSISQVHATEKRFVFPSDESVINVQKDCVAKGDGKTDDTEALQKGIDLSSGVNGKKSKVVYIPNGTYLVSKTLVAKVALGPWLYGESRDGVIIKLKDGVQNVNSVLRTHPNEKGPTSADWFMRNLRNFTIDVGNNPEVDGIRYYATNTGILQNVRVIGNGKVGINGGFLDQSGPNLVQDCEVDGFETGIVSQWIWGQTLSRITIKNCKKVGLKVVANSVAAEDLTIENVPEPIRVEIPNDWTWWGGVLAIHNAKITGSFPANSAIMNFSLLHAKNVTTKGYKFSIHSPNVPNKDVGDGKVEEYSSHGLKKLFDEADKSLNLEVKKEPENLWETDTSKWLCANDFGVIAGDNKDDTDAIQKAFDAAGKTGKTVVYFRGCGGGDPNWYNLKGNIKVPKSVKLVMGLGFGRILGENNARFIVDDDSADIVKFQNLDSFGGPPVIVENRSKSKTMVTEGCGVKVESTGTGEVFITDCSCHLLMTKPGQKTWCRQFNPEGDSDTGLAQNTSGDLWVLGLKTEGRGVRVRTTEQGRTEILGSFIYGPGVKEGDKRPIYEVDNASLSVLGFRELSFAGNTYFNKIRVSRGNEKKEFGIEPNIHGWIGWSSFQARPASK